MKMLLPRSKLKYMSQILRFPESVPKEKSVLSSCKTFKLLLSNGFIKHVNPGIFTLMPLTMRALEKLCLLIDSLMNQVNGQKVSFPSLIPKKLMSTSGRWNTIDCLFKIKDRSSSDYCLGPTHEEIATSLFSNYHISHKYLPLRLYQISSKFRDEMNPKLGLLRGREFIMKDMYSFDSSEESSSITYQTMCDLYEELFSLHLGIKPIKVQGSSGDIGGTKSHEYHFKSDIGEDQALYCPNCHNGINTELLTDKDKLFNCEQCNCPLEKSNVIEIGHAFQLGTAYSKPFEAKFDSSDNKLEYFHMSCYGLGVSRILAASLECLSTESALRWPLSIAPYKVAIIGPKKGSKEESTRPLSENIAESLNNVNYLNNDIIIDDRTNLTIGKRVQECSEIGIPHIIVVSKPALREIPKLELIDVYNMQTSFLSHKELMEFFKYDFR